VEVRPCLCGRRHPAVAASTSTSRASRGPDNGIHMEVWNCFYLTTGVDLIRLEIDPILFQLNKGIY